MRRRIASKIWTLFLLLTVVSVSVGVVAAEDVSQHTQTENAVNESTPELESVAVPEVAANASNATTYVWEAETAEGMAGYEIEASVDSPGPDTAVCLQANGSANCTAPGPNGTATLVTPGTDEAILSDLTVTLYNASANTTLDAESVSFQPIERDGDLDDDGLNNSEELTADANLTRADSDSDGLADGEEVHKYGTSPTNADTDEDGLSDEIELQKGTDPTMSDTDGDGLDDKHELEIGTNPTAVDTDGDGLSDHREVSGSTDPTVADSDGDGIIDGDELDIGTSPVKSDSDGDGLADGRELSLGTNPTVADTDGDGVSDGEELQMGTKPTVADTDDDGLNDGRELNLSTDPTTADTDGDGLSDGREVSKTGTDPLAADTDGDFLSDQQEVAWGTDPTSALTPAWVTSAFGGFVLGIGLAVTGIRRGWVTNLSNTANLLVYRLLQLDREIIEVNREITETSSSGGVDDVVATADSASAVFETVDTEFTPDEVIVDEMLKAEGGRMRQSEIVESTDWSKAKVSRLLSRMDETEDIVKIRLGRENLICLERAKPAAAGSPHGHESPDTAQPPAPGG